MKSARPPCKMDERSTMLGSYTTCNDTMITHLATKARPIRSVASNVYTVIDDRMAYASIGYILKHRQAPVLKKLRHIKSIIRLLIRGKVVKPMCYGLYYTTACRADCHKCKVRKNCLNEAI